ncbi:MAG TPA: hypothetical protein QGI39_13850, partial [Gammaproteobacteria bacterium]|nr:hypothetical protein [Gammaproteobacteria bacterium]
REEMSYKRILIFVVALTLSYLPNLYAQQIPFPLTNDEINDYPFMNASDVTPKNRIIYRERLSE